MAVKKVSITDIVKILHSVRCKSTDPDIQVTVDDLVMLCNTKEIRHIFAKLGFEVVRSRTRLGGYTYDGINIPLENPYFHDDNIGFQSPVAIKNAVANMCLNTLRPIAKNIKSLNGVNFSASSLSDARQQVFL